MRNSKGIKNVPRKKIMESLHDKKANEGRKNNAENDEHQNQSDNTINIINKHLQTRFQVKEKVPVNTSIFKPCGNKACCESTKALISSDTSKISCSPTAYTLAKNSTLSTY